MTVHFYSNDEYSMSYINPKSKSFLLKMADLAIFIKKSGQHQKFDYKVLLFWLE